MDSGMEDRSRLRHHVRAAREWLGRAEDSLDRAEDVRGDLNLMLAQAELTRAQEMERPRPSVVWAYRLAPLCVAILLASGGLWAWRSAVLQTQPPVMERRTEEAAADAVAPQFRKDTVPLPTLPQADSAPAREEPVVEMSFAETEYREPEKEVVVSTSEAEFPSEPRTDTGSVRLPSEEMQRLMSSAGQSLRAVDIERR
ncbi:MAG: hypothetical protein IKZ66_07565 [Schwartzia sp.]|nr:hypothetical protein [Schwartzia sp. (in: firmicutes)]